MIIAKSRRLIHKLFVLGLLLACLGLFSGDVGTKASCDANNRLLPCCSYCDELRMLQSVSTAASSAVGPNNRTA